MGKGRRISVLSAAVLSLASITAAAPASAVPARSGPAPSVPAKPATGPQPVSERLRAVEANRPTVIGIRWKTDRRICHVRVILWGNRRIETEYPWRRDYSSFDAGATLRAGRTDVTLFKVTADYDRTASALVGARITYDYCGWNSPTITRNTGMVLPVRGD